MIRVSYAYLRFHVRRLHRDQGAAFLATLVLAGCTLLTLAAWAIEASEVSRAKQELQDLITRAARAPQQVKASGSQLPNLDTVSFVAAIHRSAAESKIGTDEVTYVLEDQPTLPYIRYRARFSIEAPYPTIRQFIQGVVDAETNTALDGISCARTELKGTRPVCDIAISAFYKRDARG